MAQNSLTVGFSYLIREASRFLGYDRATVYATGTVAITAGVVTLTTGVFPSWLTTAHTFVYNDVTYSISIVTDTTHITLTDTTLTGVSAGANYWVVALFPDQTTDVIDCYRSGLRNFYNPPVLPGERWAHRWSYLFPETTVSTVAAYSTGTITVVAGVVTLASGTWPIWAASGELAADSGRYTIASRDTNTQLTLNDTSVTVAAGSSYTLGQWVFPFAADFAALNGPLTFDPNSLSGWFQLPLVSALEIHTNRAPFPITGRPVEAAVRQKETFDPTVGQRYELLLWPTPNAVYTLRYRYECNPNNLDATNAYIRGGQPHMETMLESILAACEVKMNDQIGLHKQLFMERLAASVSHDRKAGAPDTLGYDDAARRDDSLTYTDYHDWNRPSFTYNGLTT